LVAAPDLGSGPERGGGSSPSIRTLQFFNPALNITIEKMESLQGFLHLELLPEDWEANIKNALKEVVKKAQLPGFRPGMVPASLIRKKYGQGIMYEELNKVLSDNLNQYITEQRLPLLGNPLPVPKEEIQLDIDDIQPMSFTYEIGFAPEFHLDLSSLPVLDQPVIDIDQLYFEGYLNRLKRSKGKMTNPEEAGSGDTLFGNLYASDSNGNPLEEGFKRNIALNPEILESTYLDALIPGKKAGDVFEFDLVNGLDSNKQRGWLLNCSDEMLEERLVHPYYFEVKKVNHVDPAELNQEFFDQILGPGKVNSEEEFIAELKQNLVLSLEGQAKIQVENQVFDLLMNNLEIPLPDGFLRKWLLSSADEQKLTPEILDNEYPAYARSLRWNLIQNKWLSEHPEVQLTNEEVEQAVGAFISSQIGLDINQFDAERKKTFLDIVYKNEENMDKITRETMQNKVLESIASNLTFRDVPVSATEFSGR